MQGSSGTSDTSTPSHLPLLSTLSSSSSSPPPTIASGTGEVQGEPRSHQSYRHHHHYHYQPSWSPRGSPEVPTSFSLGSEVKQVKPLRSFGYSAKGCQETSQSKPRSVVRVSVREYKVEDERLGSWRCFIGWSRLCVFNIRSDHFLRLSVTDHSFQR